MKNAGMAGAVALVGIGLMTIGLSNFHSTPQAQAAPVATVNHGPEEPTIVAFGSISGAGDSSVLRFYRVWSDGRIELRFLDMEERDPSYIICLGFNIQPGSSCGTDQPMDTGWFELPPPPGGDGFACRSDINGDRRVDGADLATVLAQWGVGVSCDPQPSYPCFDLSNLNTPKGAM